MNPLLKRNCLPLFEKIKVEHISPAIDEIINKNIISIKKIESDKKNPNWDNFVTPLEKCEEKLSRAWSQISHLNYVMNNEPQEKYTMKTLLKLQNTILLLGKMKLFIRNLYF